MLLIKDIQNWLSSSPTHSLNELQIIFSKLYGVLIHTNTCNQTMKFSLPCFPLDKEDPCAKHTKLWYLKFYSNTIIIMLYYFIVGGSMHLPPLQGTNVNTPTKRKPLPPIDTNLVAPSRGGQAEYPAGDTIISVPQGGGSAPSQTSHGMISMPGRTSESSRVGKRKTNYFITSPPVGVARYCFQPVCVCVCLCVLPIFWYFISRLLEELSIWNLYRILRPKKKSVFGVTWPKKRGSVGRLFFFSYWSLTSTCTTWCTSKRVLMQIFHVWGLVQEICKSWEIRISYYFFFKRKHFYIYILSKFMK